MPTKLPDRILLVDDEQAVLDALCRQHRKRYELVTACGAEAALETLRAQGPFAAIVADFQMPRMNGVQLLGHVRELEPEVVRIMLTGQADLTLAIDAVNRGQIFRFLTKPCDPEVFRAGLDAALEQHSLRHAERILLEHTVRGSIEVLVDVLALANPAAFGRASRIRRYVRHVVHALRLPNAWQFETAALLSQIGCVAIPSDVIDRVVGGQELSPEQHAMMERHPELARDLLRKIPRLQVVADIVSHQRADSKASSQNPQVVLGGRILAGTLAFEELLSVGATAEQAIQALRAEGAKHDARVLEALASAEVVTVSSDVRLLPVDRLEPGMVLLEDVRNVHGTLIVGNGHELGESSLHRLRNHSDLNLLTRKELRVRLPRPALEQLDASAA